MAIEQVLYAQEVMLCQKYFKIPEENRYKNEDKFKFQGQSEISQHWFYLDLDWIEERFSIPEHDLYKEIYQRHD